MNEPQEFITRCPSCNTSFRITSEQIDTADGAARCGACLRIFQADQQLVVESSGDLPGGTEEANPQSWSSEDSNADSIQSALGDGVLEDFAFDSDSVEGMVHAESVPEDIGEIRVEDEEHDEFIQESKDDETIAGNQPDIENEARISKEVQSEGLPNKEHLADERGNHDLTPSDLAEEEVVFDRFTIKELEKKYWQDWEDYLRPYLKLNGGSQPVSIEQQVSPYINNENFSNQNEISDIREAEEEDDEAASSSDKEETAFIPALDLGHDPDELVGELKPEERLNPLWIVASIILLISGSFQYIWFSKDLYAQNNSYRSYYLVMCDWIDCELPDYSNGLELVAKNLLIRSHSQIESALIVDAILENSGQYRQKFPDLRLWFRDIGNVPVAARRFTPADYLAGELRGLRYIPADTEVRFSIEITDPGENALGYSLEVLPQG